MQNVHQRKIFSLALPLGDQSIHFAISNSFLSEIPLLREGMEPKTKKPISAKEMGFFF